MGEFDFLDDLRRLSGDQQERFQRVVSRLLGGEVISAGANPLLLPDADWRFLQNNLRLVDAYLDVAGWRVDVSHEHRMARALHKEGQHKVRFDLLESLALCILRLAYHEQMSSGSREDRCEVPTGELRERVALAQRSSAPISRTRLAPAIRKLARYGIVDVEWGYDAEDTDLIVVTPVVEMVLSPDAVHRFFQQYANPGAGAAPEEATPGADRIDDEVLHHA